MPRGMDRGCDAGIVEKTKRATGQNHCGEVLVLLLVLILCPAAQAKPKRPQPGVVLVHEEHFGKAQAADVAKAATAARAKQGPFVPPPPVALSDLERAFGCKSFDDACIGQIASSAGAGWAFVVEAQQNGPGYTINTRFVGVEGKPPTASLELPGLDVRSTDILEKFAVAAAEGRVVAFVRVETALTGATVRLDDKDIEINTTVDVPPGLHTLTFKAGDASEMRQVELLPNTFQVESFSATPAASSTTAERAPAIATEDIHTAVTKPLPYAGIGLVALGGALGLVGGWFATSWVAGYAQAAQVSAAAQTDKDAALGTCVGLCSDEVSWGPGVTGPARAMFAEPLFKGAGVSQAALPMAASLATVALAAGAVGVGIYLLLDDEPR